MANIGDKFIITIGDKMQNEQSGETLYRVKGFKSLVFDDKGIEKLIPYKENPAEKCYRCGEQYIPKCPEYLCRVSKRHPNFGKGIDLCYNCSHELEKWLKGEKHE